MPFRPKVNNYIDINNHKYFFSEHPAAKGMPYGQTGRRATVFQIIDEAKEAHALKIFTNAFRTSNTASQSKIIDKFAGLPGLLACKRLVLTPESFPKLITTYPDLSYSVLMPWIQGSTWQEIILNQLELTKSQSKIIALSFLQVMCSMEREGIAHCDLSGPNLIIDPGLFNNNNNSSSIQLIDLEDLFSKDLPHPERKPGGSAGYAHKSSIKGIWDATADRFAGAILLAEMLGWSDPKIRDNAFGEQYFSSDELQTTCFRYSLLYDSLNANWGGAFARLFKNVWFSSRILECPTFSTWVDLFSEKLVHEKQTSDEGVNNTSVSSPVLGWRNLSGEAIALTSTTNPIDIPAPLVYTDDDHMFDPDRKFATEVNPHKKNHQNVSADDNWENIHLGESFDPSILTKEASDTLVNENHFGEFFVNTIFIPKDSPKIINCKPPQENIYNVDTQKHDISDSNHDDHLFPYDEDTDKRIISLMILFIIFIVILLSIGLNY